MILDSKEPKVRNQRFPFEIIKLKKWNWKKAEPSIAEKAQPIITLFIPHPFWNSVVLFRREQKCRKCSLEFEKWKSKNGSWKNVKWNETIVIVNEISNGKKWLQILAAVYLLKERFQIQVRIYLLFLLLKYVLVKAI